VHATCHSTTTNRASASGCARGGAAGHGERSSGPSASQRATYAATPGVVASATVGLASGARPSASVTSPGATVSLIVARMPSTVTSTYLTEVWCASARVANATIAMIAMIDRRIGPRMPPF
jgi:hypothetical protein